MGKLVKSILVGRADVHFDPAEVEGVISVYMDGRLNKLADNIASEAKASTEFQDYKGTPRESEWSKKKWAGRRSKRAKLRRQIYVDPLRDQSIGYEVRAKVPHAHLVEFGHILVTKGKVRGRVRPRPFLEKAADRWMHAEIFETGGFDFAGWAGSGL